MTDSLSLINVHLSVWFILTNKSNKIIDKNTTYTRNCDEHVHVFPPGQARKEREESFRGWG